MKGIQSIFGKVLQKKYLGIPQQYRFFGSLQEELFELEQKMLQQGNKQKNQNVGNVIEVKNDIIIFSTFTENELKYLSVIENDAGQKFLVLRIDEKLSAALSLNNSKVDTLSPLKISRSQSYLSLDLNNQYFSRINNYKGPLDLNENSSKFLKIFRNVDTFSKRITTRTQLFSGNIQLDFSKPIAKGHMVLLRGEPNTGKTHLCMNTIIQFLQKKKKLTFFNNNIRSPKVIYVSLNNQNSEKIMNEAQKHDLQEDICIFGPGKGSSAEQLLAPYSAIILANHLQQQGNDVLFVFDNYLEHFYKEIQLFWTINIDQVIYYNVLSLLKRLCILIFQMLLIFYIANFLSVTYIFNKQII